MISRPCRTDSDLSRLWQLLLPGTPLPACGTTTADAAQPSADPAPPSDQGPPPGAAASTTGKRDV
jgi:hypothetical protein